MFCKKVNNLHFLFLRLFWNSFLYEILLSNFRLFRKNKININLQKVFNILIKNLNSIF